MRSLAGIARAGIAMCAFVGWSLQAQPVPLSFDEAGSIRLSTGSPKAGEAPSGIASVAWLTAMRDGSAFAMDGHSGAVVRIDRAERLQSRFTVDGLVGNSAFNALVGATTLADSILVVWNANDARVILLRFDGQEIRRLRVPQRGYSVGAENAVSRVDDRTFAVRALWGAPPGREFWYRYRIDGTLVDSVESGRPRRQWGTPDGLRVPYLASRLTIPCATSGWLTIDAQTGAVADSASRVVLSSPTFVERILVADAERAKWIPLLDGESGSRPATLPTQKPVARSGFCDGDGRLWLDLYGRASIVAREISPLARQWADVPRENARFLGIRLGGEVVGELAFPSGQSLLDIGGDIIWAVRSEPNALVALRLRSR